MSSNHIHINNPYVFTKAHFSWWKWYYTDKHLTRGRDQTMSTDWYRTSIMAASKTPSISNYQCYSNCFARVGVGWRGKERFIEGKTNKKIPVSDLHARLWLSKSWYTALGGSCGPLSVKFRTRHSKRVLSVGNRNWHMLDDGLDVESRVPFEEVGAWLSVDVSPGSIRRIESIPLPCYECHVMYIPTRQEDT